ncbi:hypothetical protein LTR28_011187 [Elasticomyces elasticus]|nr:hypothetical protein LTR28_011187 [Elasticomyces elasticus]
MFYATFSHKKSRKTSLIIAFSLIGLAVFITAYYHYLQDPVFHQNMYALLTAIVLFRSIYIMEVNMRPTLRRRREVHKAIEGRQGSTGEQERCDDRDARILRNMWIMVTFGLSIFLGGFGIWTLDNVYCSTLRRWRREIGLPWGVLLEGHGWWHLMTGLGAYFYITWGIWLRHCLDGEQDLYELRWPSSFTSLPIILRAGGGEARLNGSVVQRVEAEAEQRPRQRNGALKASLDKKEL